jgi:ADP-ribose pyrophosphatase YjhB (NUDIX family)
MPASEFPKPSVTVDVVIITLRGEELQVLLVKRNFAPFKGRWAIPGGFVHISESLETAARRELREETGVTDVYLEQLYTFGDPGRDPRGRVISVTYIVLVRPAGGSGQRCARGVLVAAQRIARAGFRSWTRSCNMRLLSALQD